MKRLLSSFAVAALLVGTMVGPASAARPNVVATIHGGGTSTMAEVFGIPHPGSSVFGFNVTLVGVQRPGTSFASTSTAPHRVFWETSSAKSSAGRETSTARSP